MFQIIKNSIAVFLSILLFQELLFPMEEGITNRESLSFPLFSYQNQNKNGLHILIYPSVPNVSIQVHGNSGSTNCPYCGDCLIWQSTKNDPTLISRAIRKNFMKIHFLYHEEKQILEELKKIFEQTPDVLVPNFKEELEKIIQYSKGNFKCIFSNCNIPYKVSAAQHIMSHVKLSEYSIPNNIKRNKKFFLFSHGTIGGGKNKNITLCLSIQNLRIIEVDNNGVISLRCPYPHCNKLLDIVPRGFKAYGVNLSEKELGQRITKLRKKFLAHLLLHEKDKILDALSTIPSQLVDNFQDKLETITNGSFRSIEKCIFKNCPYNSFNQNEQLREHTMSHINIEPINDTSNSPLSKKCRLGSTDQMPSSPNFNDEIESLFNLED